MARKMNPLKLAQKIPGNAAVTDRRPEIQMAALYLMQARNPVLKISPPGRRLRVTVEVEAHADIPQAVKIIHAG